MNVVELYQQTPVDKHSEILVSGDRLFFEGEEYIIGADEELKMIRSDKQLEQKLSEIINKLDIK
jgi:hypothetical protein